MTTRRNFLIRTVVALGADIAVACALASVCAWLIQAAALGVFLTFMVWVIGLLLALAISQYLVHPSVRFLLSDQKLNDTLSSLGDLSTLVGVIGQHAGRQLWASVKVKWNGAGGFSSRFKPA